MKDLKPVAEIVLNSLLEVERYLALLHVEKLFNQYVVDAYVKTESNNLNFLRTIYLCEICEQ